MAANTNPVFTLTPRIGGANVSATQDSSYTAPTHTVTVLTGGTNGTRIDEIDCVGLGTTVAGVIQLYLYDVSNTTYHPIDTFLVTVVTPSTTVAPFLQKLYFQSLILPTNWNLVATSFAASQLIQVLAYGGDF